MPTGALASGTRFSPVPLEPDACREDYVVIPNTVRDPRLPLAFAPNNFVLSGLLPLGALSTKAGYSGRRTTSCIGGGIIAVLKVSAFKDGAVGEHLR